MRKLAIIFFATIFSLAMAKAQAPQGSIYLGSSTSLMGGVTYFQPSGSNSAGVSFNKTKTKSDGQSVDGPETRSINLSPKIGYAFMDGFVGGLKMDVLSFRQKYGDFEYTTNGVAAGPFLRYYIPTAGNAMPFIEAEGTIGRVSGDNDELNTLYFSGGAGVAFFFNDYVSFDFMAGYSHGTVKDADSENDVKEIANGFGVGLGFTFFIDTN